MKPLPILSASTLLTLLLVVPAFGATSVTVSVAQPSYSGTAVVNVSGTVSPAPGPSQAVFIQVTNPAGQTFPVGTANIDPTTGAFSASFNTGGPYFSSQGTYTVTASFGSASGSATFSYTPTGGGGGGGGGVGVTSAQFKANITAIMNQISALQTSVNQLQSTVSAMQSAQTTQSNQLTSISGTLSTMQNSLTSLSATVGNINSAVQALGSQVQNAATQATNAANSAGTSQTYVLVVAILAAITLVLELAILVRKLS